ncbi:MAG: UDP-N-acetylmuramoyl-tripeptide--D-alanyl-D-alanine ligase [Gammaproteobacteria bacterium]|nr:UDP-N-acetylmuramoyl-tripeptide--D-alanyl-D-alanine ligase [Gammaproteobacteria bacterium]
MRLAETAELLQAGLQGADAWYTGLGTDTRSLEAENLFVALRGPRFNGETFLEQARARGAVGALVSRDVAAADLPLLAVDDTRHALGRLAAHWRSRFSIPLVGITGSNGKTTVKEMTAAILGRRGPALVTRGNLNNDIGVPLTLARLGLEHGTAVIEMGANHAGEIAYLTDLVQPTVGLVNNAGPAHLEGFGSLTGVARAKGELFQHLPAGAVAVINAEDRFAPLWREFAGDHPQLSFGIEGRADVQATWRGDASGSELDMSTPQGSLSLRLPLPGRHNVMNALAATAASLAAGATLEEVRAGLQGLPPVQGRLQRIALADAAVLIDDTYNANPGSLRAGIEVLALGQGPKWLVLGDMAELGPEGERMHRQMGKLARETGVERLFALGDLAAAAAETFGAHGVTCPSREALISTLEQDWCAGVQVLVKGSRSMGMEAVVNALRARHGEAR